MSENDRIRWDAAYTGRESGAVPALPQAFRGHADRFPVTGTALDVACGSGLGSMWLARRGLQVRGVDVSAVAITQARQLAAYHGVAERCRFDVADLDRGLPAGPPVDVVLCHRFRDSGLYPALAARLRPGGLLAICVLSEVGADPGRFRAPAGELEAAFAGLEMLAAHEGGGEAWLLARAPLTGRR
ncbi:MULTISPECIES: bifunctional 2-polyprenyl-6-hydroxyphenol methylase/3-demethylubiquinol 3-O-methyltransferase UbiG [unclassified Mycolicibacterium]|uniref:class I SAM-dependent methyltransferase n=1 Tax=unclassified Mycolicibacterium TaxID=2636767 RepID=UPI0013082D07|nr:MULTISPECIES: class I SAM-dependent methyltransferase [unclassified Mycolicibacterium]MUL83630.1 class I SAM-dependent methyltransferase [Mycolicibacterium sp. CBMA 329]MUL90621.1 class I SAM-dependent methyltransferase [Mycolicibacterium sp. CBMA 331]MUM00591.1 class I SAM-dependent methyltransferase [Mycolicibacterium sp. CBMA 334]MUM25482.1 class I SAM-dependent methyltransferase [Mycolicibacterium sp. CBMA 295]MUM41565.1 class I SAM-dependent methyltransferase [Mycolicibacterium sp. CBM